MLQSEYSSKDFCELVDKIGSRRVDSFLGNTRLGCKVQGLFDGKGGEMNVIFRTVLDISSIKLGNIRRGQRVIVNIAFD